MAQTVNYEQGMTKVWSDGEKITVINEAGTRWLKDNVEQIFGMGEWAKIEQAIYFKVDHLRSPENNIRKFECISGYIPQRVLEDIQELSEELPEDVKKDAALEALKNV
jgi:hypothetical protein